MNSEITTILRLNGWAGWLVLGLYGTGTTIVALLNLDGLVVPALGVVALVLLWGGLVILGLPNAEPLELRSTLALLLIVSGTTAISSWNLVDPAKPGYATWPLGAMTFLLFVLALRGRRGYAWVGFGALALVSIIVALVTDLDIVRVVNDVLRQSATLVIGTLFAIILRRASQTITAIQNNQLTRATLAAANSAATRERAAQNARLERDARPALERIISDVPLSTEELRHFALLESTLRDGIRATGFSGENIAEAARLARDRGLRVVLLDDRGIDLTEDDRLRIEGALLQQLEETTEGSITARLSPDDRDEIATIVVEENGEYRRVVVTPFEVEITHL